VYRRQINSGIAWLNKVDSGWYKKIDLEMFDIGDADRCVCGQVFQFVAPEKGAGSGYDYFINVYDPGDEEQAEKYGFTIPDTNSYQEEQRAWEALQAEWVEKIKELQANG
jgi:hypothetical protein